MSTDVGVMALMYIYMHVFVDVDVDVWWPCDLVTIDLYPG